MELPIEYKNNMKKLLGADYDKYISSLNNKRLYGLRVNTSKLSVDEFVKIAPFPITEIPYIPNGFFYDGETYFPAKHPYYFAGLYYLQDPSAMTSASRLPVERGLRVLDLCAAPGGKSTELAARLCGEGLLVANDVSAKRAKALQKNIELFGIKNSVITTEYPHKLAESLPEYFDRILVDAPCSGEGMFRKDPAMIKAWDETSPDSYAALQAEILESAIAMLKKGGYLLYSTCTFSPKEDEGTVANVLERGDMELIWPQWYEGFSEGMPSAIGSDDEELKKCIRIFPHRMDGEGHFIALFKKKTDESSGGDVRDNDAFSEGNSFYEEKYSDKKSTVKAKNRKNNKSLSKKTGTINRLSKEEKALWESFAAGFSDENNPPFSSENIESHDGKLYYIADDIPDMRGLKFIRRGLYLGECKKNRFEPAQSLAMALKSDEYKYIISLSAADPRVIKYLKGETIVCEDTGVSDGWVLICVDGFALGWGKKSGSTIKNKYHSGWRLM